MFWPFKRRPPRRRRREELIAFILDRAQSLAADADPGKTFSVKLPRRLRDGYYPEEIIGPVMTRDRAYGVIMQYVHNWTFVFRRKNDSSPQ